MVEQASCLFNIAQARCLRHRVWNFVRKNLAAAGFFLGKNVDKISFIV
jgi:hypothetical protein